ncbi:NAD(P)H-flavin reductase [Aliiglaciecola sp. LCG003]|uniref:NAD(P)H-flavin reductase n=1 Tax=Aliiglaciecola sp. LCG003 TaxID=3053655 RepID=UPI002573C3CD|nr:NAD(P)H-flavin reductase [Aliiglaciecola sp. LCG003]WJG10147.1 NAD(P)H-flavin reductase [Aliiglaciecola sp. LCG003]
MTPISSKVESIEPLTSVVSKVVLTSEQPMAFKAGQYLRVVMGAKDLRPFSIANIPNDDNRLELHIGADVNNAYASEVLERMQQQGTIEIDGGHGQAFLRENNIKPTILLAGGTGFSYAYSILQRRLLLPNKDPVFLYWGCRTLQDMYAYEALQQLQKQHSHFKFHPVVDAPDETWKGKYGWVHKAVMQDFVSLESYQVYVAGRFEMAGVAREDFHNKGLLLENLYGDAYQFI